MGKIPREGREKITPRRVVTRPGALRPTPADLAAAAGRTIPDVIRADLDILLCGINPSLYSAATGHHFARPGNRFWPALALAGLTPELFAPAEQFRLLDLGLGITNLVARATARADELTGDEIRAGELRLRRKVARLRPRYVAFLGLDAYRLAFGERSAQVGEQRRRIARARIWLLPNPSGLNASWSLQRIAEALRELASATGLGCGLGQPRGSSPQCSSRGTSR